MAALAATNLRKTYGDTEVVAGLSFAVQPGTCFGLLGPNGAGKTTTISMICGLLTPTAGTVHVLGREITPSASAAKSAIGLVPQELTLDAFETVENTVAFSRGLLGCKPDPALIERILRDL